MIEEDMMKLRARDLRRLRVIHHVLEKRLTQVQAAALLGLTDRHVRRLVQGVRREGDRAVVHRRRGQPSNRRLPAGLKTKVLRVYDQHYGDFGPTLAAEKLAERHGIRVSKETLRGWLREQGVDHFAADRGRIACGGPARHTWASWSSWMARIMSGWRAGGRGVC
jgi:transposase